MTQSQDIERFFRSRLRLSQVRLLAAIDDLKQLKRVAQSLNVTPPAVSKQVAEMESELGQKLSRRIGHRVEFTSAGALLARHARQVLDQLDRTRIELTELLSGTSEHIGIGAIPTIASFFLPALVHDLRARSPNTSIRLREGRFAELAPLLEDGTLDIILARDTEHRFSANFSQRVVMKDPVAVVCGQAHTLASRRGLTWKDLDGMPWILPLQGSTTAQFLENLLAQENIRPGPGSIESISLAVNASLLCTSSLLGFTPLAYIRDYVKSGRICVLPLSTAEIQHEIKIVWRSDNTNPVTSLLFNLVHKHASQL